MDAHPARFPSQLPEYFIRMLTDPGDVVVDPFGGSCVTGMVAERLKRHWTCVEMSESYLKGALGRFKGKDSLTSAEKPMRYTISTPCSQIVDEANIRLPKDGGQSHHQLEIKAAETKQKKMSKSPSIGVKTIESASCINPDFI